MTPTRYEITVELPNGDWIWTRTAPLRDFHELCEVALDYAKFKLGRVHHVEKIP